MTLPGFPPYILPGRWGCLWHTNHRRMLQCNANIADEYYKAAGIPLLDRLVCDHTRHWSSVVSGRQGLCTGKKHKIDSLIHGKSFLFGKSYAIWAIWFNQINYYDFCEERVPRKCIKLNSMEFYDKSKTGLLMPYWSYCIPVMLYGIINPGQHWAMQKLVTCSSSNHYWTNTDLLPFGCMHMN